jgi:pyruvate/2-oxoacid:ferredoxin oxidoreductase beta subunit
MNKQERTRTMFQVRFHGRGGQGAVTAAELLATESGLFPVFEAEAGQVTSSTPIRRQVPVTDYLRLQARYAHLFKPEENTEVIGRIQAAADRNIRRFGLMSPDNERGGSPAPATAISPGRAAP